MAHPCVSTSTVKSAKQVSVYKDECVLCFNSCDDPEGIYVCLQCFQGGCPSHAALHYKKSGHALHMVIKRRKNPEVIKKRREEITKVAIGVEGGLQEQEGEDFYLYDNSAHCFKCDRALTTQELQDPVIAGAMKAISEADSVSKTQDMASKWENVLIQCEHGVLLQQNPDAPKLKEKALSTCNKCELAHNLWLCLQCGHLGCGRSNFLGTGGNGHAVEHTKETGHALVCKIGTITPDGKGDVHCYTCDEERLDPFLSEHLRFLGINIEDQQKTEKSLAEEELEQNLKLDLLGDVDREGKKYKKFYGSGFTGFRNLGNTCYMASVMQLAFATPDFVQHYFKEGQEHIASCTNVKPQDCYMCQMAKVAHGLYSGNYSRQPKELPEDSKVESDLQEEDQAGIPPRMLKHLLCASHPDFKTNEQQDAYEFWQFFMKSLKERERIANNDPTKPFQIRMEQRLQCSKCKKVKYSTRPAETDLSVGLATQAAQPPLVSVKDEKEQDRVKRESESKIKFEDCLAMAFSPETVSFTCSHCNSISHGTKTNRVLTFPDFLVTQVRRFDLLTVVSVQVPDKINLEAFRAKGPQKDEDVISQETEEEGEEAVLEVDETIVVTLESTGYPKNHCERAVFETKNRGVEDAMMWLLDHLDSPLLSEPIPRPKKKKAKADDVDPEALSQLVSMGISERHGRRALQETSGDVNRAIDWVFSHEEEPDVPAPKKEEKNNNSQAVADPVDNRPAEYDFFGFIVHLGSHTGCGHYVAFIKKDNQWVKYNDRKVTEGDVDVSQAAYMYFFKRRG